MIRKLLLIIFIGAIAFWFLAYIQLVEAFNNENREAIIHWLTAQRYAVVLALYTAGPLILFYFYHWPKIEALHSRYRHPAARFLFLVGAPLSLPYAVFSEKQFLRKGSPTASRKGPPPGNSLFFNFALSFGIILVSVGAIAGIRSGSLGAAGLGFLFLIYVSTNRRRVDEILRKVRS